MLWVKAFHVIAIVCWFAGLFYLPRLYVYHALSHEKLVREQLKIMEYKLYYYIMTPSALATVILGLSLWLPHYSQYAHDWWLHIKLVLVGLLIIYHIYCGILLERFKVDDNRYRHVFYRYFNEIPTVVLIAVVILSVVKPM